MNSKLQFTVRKQAVLSLLLALSLVNRVADCELIAAKANQNGPILVRTVLAHHLYDHMYDHHMYDAVLMMLFS